MVSDKALGMQQDVPALVITALPGLLFYRVKERNIIYQFTKIKLTLAFWWRNFDNRQLLVLNKKLKRKFMIEYVHKHITSELDQNTRTDTIFILTSIILNLITLAVNSSIATSSRRTADTSMLVVMFVFICLIIVVNLVAVIGLIKGKSTREKLLKGLIDMYKDQNVDKYYDASLLGNYNLRYNLFILVVVFTGVIASIVPFILR
jgi:hypothetical protein